MIFVGLEECLHRLPYLGKRKLDGGRKIMRQATVRQGKLHDHDLGAHLGVGAEVESLYYSILNVSNLRPVFLSAWLNARLLCEPSRPAWELLAELVEEFYGERATDILPLYKSYYVAIADFGKDELIARLPSYCSCITK